MSNSTHERDIKKYTTITGLIVASSTCTSDGKESLQKCVLPQERTELHVRLLLWPEAKAGQKRESIPGNA
jgi:hypothetical protein